MSDIDPILAQMLRDTGMTLEQWEQQKTRTARETTGGPFSSAPLSGVTKSDELTRILKLPRRQWEADVHTYADKVTEVFRAPGGTMKLRPVQAATLRDAHDQGGAFCPQGVGKGKCADLDSEIYDAIEGRRRTLREFGPVGVASMEGAGKIGAYNSVIFPSGTKPCVRLTLRDGAAVVLSTDHPVFTHYGWVKAAEIPADALVAVPRELRMPAPTIATDDEVAFAAYLLSDGGVSQAHTTFTNGTQSIIDDFVSLAVRVTGVAPRVEKGRGCLEFKVRNAKPFREKWSIYGLAKEKRLPASFWGLPDRQIGLFLNRFWACDGTIGGGVAEVALASEKMIDDLKFLLLRLGIRGRKKYKKATCTNCPGNKSFDSWRLSVRGADLLRFVSRVGEPLGKEESLRKQLLELKSKQRNTNVDVVPISKKTCQEIGNEMGWPGVGGDYKTRKATGLLGMRSAFAKALGATYGQWVSREKFAQVCELFGYRGRYAWLATSDLSWERVRSLEPVGDREVADLTVPATGNFICDNIVVHNTVSSLLVFTVLKAQRPLLLIPAKLKEKTTRDLNTLRKHWLVPGFVYVLTYDLLSRPQSKDLLENWQPDVIVADEAHRMRNLSSATAKRVQRYMQAHPETKMVALSGTLMKRSIADWSHIAEWCLRERSPAPRDFSTRTAWAAALDEKTGGDGWFPGKEEGQHLSVGALVELCTPEEIRAIDHGGEDPVRTVRKAFRRRLTDSPGVVATQEDALAMSLRIEPLIVKSPTITQVCNHALLTGERPDGFELVDGAAVWQHVRTCATGFYYRQNPAPPFEWTAARKAWAATVRRILSSNHRGLDSEFMVKSAVAKGEYPDATAALEAWEAIRKDYDPEKNREAVFFTDEFVDACLKWAEEEKGIIWVEHVALGKRLAAKSGLPFYQNLGFTQDGTKRFIEDHPKGTPMIAAREPNFEGRNLQFGWSTMLITTPHTAGYIFEQQLGRLHREGQEADEVVATICAAHPKMFELFDQACSDARVISDSLGQEQKLCYADITVPPPLERVGLWD